jgi:hypothetical protein
MARQRVAAFALAWRRCFPTDVEIDVRVEGERLRLDDLEALSKPRVVIRTLAQLQALPAGTKLAVQGDRAAQIDKAEAYDEGTGEELEAKRLLYVGTDLYDNLLPDPSAEELDTLRRMLPAIVIDPLD